jgi:hypothetical protein
MLPSLARLAPTGVPLSSYKITVTLNFKKGNPKGTVIMETMVTGSGSNRGLDWVLDWVGKMFGFGERTKLPMRAEWEMSHKDFSAAVKRIQCSEVNTAGTYSNTTPWTLETNEQTLLDTDGTQILRLVFAIDQ